MLLLLGGGYDDGVLEDVLGPAQSLVGDEGAVGAGGEVGWGLGVGLDPFLWHPTFSHRLPTEQDTDSHRPTWHASHVLLAFFVGLRMPICGLITDWPFIIQSRS